MHIYSKRSACLYLIRKFVNISFRVNSRLVEKFTVFTSRPLAEQNYSTGKIELQSYFLRFNKNYENLNKFILFHCGICAERLYRKNWFIDKEKQEGIIEQDNTMEGILL